MTRLLTLRETAAALRVARSTFYRLDAEGWLSRWGLVEAPRRPGGKRRWVAASVERAAMQGASVTLRVRPALLRTPPAQNARGGEL